MGEAKPWYQSKTLLTNLTALAAWILTLAVTSAQAGELPTELAPYAVLIALVGNVLLRLITTQPVIPPVVGRKLPFVLLLVLVPATIARAAPPRAVIDGPSSVRVAGQKLVLRAADTTITSAKGFRWTINPEVKGMEQLTVLDGGKAVLVHTIPGHYVVTLVVAGPAAADGSIDIDSITHDLVIPGDAPCPPPEPKPVVPTPIPPIPSPTPPVPPPAPQPNNVPDTMGIAAQVIAAAKASNDRAGALVLAERAAVLAKEIRQREVERARAAALGQTPPAPFPVPQVAERIAAGIKETGPKWSAFLTAAKGCLQQLLASGKLNAADVIPWATLLEEIAAALREAAK